MAGQLKGVAATSTRRTLCSNLHIIFDSLLDQVPLQSCRDPTEALAMVCHAAAGFAGRRGEISRAAETRQDSPIPIARLYQTFLQRSLDVLRS